MDEYILITKIAYVFLTLTALTMNLTGIPTAYMELEANVNQSHQNDYQKMAIMENVMSLDVDYLELRQVSDFNEYYYEQQRAVIPFEYFWEQREGASGVGYLKNDEHCYIDDVPGLDGERYGFFIRKMDRDRSSDPGFNSPRTLGCTDIVQSGERISAPALLVRKGNGNPRLPVRIYIYDIGEGTT